MLEVTMAFLQQLIGELTIENRVLKAELERRDVVEKEAIKQKAARVKDV